MEDVNKYLNNYNEKKVSWITRKLWWCAGADEQILMQCPMADRVKYSGIGGIVFATGMLAFLSGTFAFYTVFGPKEEAISNDPLAWGKLLLCIGLGFAWGLMIFNIDKFIVSSTGKGDGSDKMTWPELRNAVPRILMALILGIAISAPLEIQILKTEIDVKLQEKQDELLYQSNKTAELIAEQDIAKFEKDRAVLEKKITDIDSYFEKRRLEIQDARKRLEDEIAGRIGSGKAGEGPAAAAQRENLASQEKELEEQKNAKLPEMAGLKQRMENINAEIKNVENDKIAKKLQNKEKAKNLDGLLERISISHELSWWIPKIIAAVILCIEMGPIFFKMMMVRGAYDYLVENNKKKIQAQHGVLITEKLIDTVNGAKQGEKVSYLEEYHELFVKQKQLEEQNKNAEKVVKKHSEKISKDIDENPENFYTES